MATKVNLQGDRKWNVDSSGDVVSVTRRYQIIRDAVPAGTAAEEIASIDGLPKIGEKHSEKYDRLIVSSISFSEGDGGDKKIIYADVTYQPTTITSETVSEEGEFNVVSWGWRSGSVSRDLVRDAGSGKLVVNSAGQPFDSVPQIDFPAPTLTKVIKMKKRQSGWMGYAGKVNSAEITIGEMSVAKHCVRCIQIDEERLFNDETGYKYQYTCAFQVMNNSVCVEGAEAATDIGWDVAVVDCGTMQRKDDKLVPIKSVSEETGQEVFVSNPVLLDGKGVAALAKDSKPYAFRIQAYNEATFPTAMYSEP